MNATASTLFASLLLAGAGLGHTQEPIADDPTVLSASSSAGETESEEGVEASPGPDEGATPASAAAADVGGAASDGEEAAEPARPQEGFLPRLDVFFPEGDLDLRVSRLEHKVFFEGQVKYNIIEGDITAFLRYRYYSFRRIYQLSAFDSVEFDGIEELSDEFSRVRGILFLTHWPQSYHRRIFLLAELDRIISNKEELRFSNNRTNTYVRLGYQLGTPRDDRSNAVVGESRARIERLFTPFREIGPGGAGFTGALTYGFDVGPGDFDYVKLELEALKRFRLPGRFVLVGRLHGGSFLLKKRVRSEEEIPDLFEGDRYSIPRSELFRLDGRENLKGLKEGLRGTEEIHTTWELFFPWFLDQQRRLGSFEWQNWYWILYAGLGNAGFDPEIYTDYDEYIPDVGVGFESSFRLKKYSFFLSGVLAQSLHRSGGVEGRLSIKSYH